MKAALGWQHRIFRFSLVGALGIALQSIALCGLVKAHVNYLLATGLAVESAIVHNFVWHQQFTWHDRIAKHGSVMLRRFFHFHLSNGAISLVGNLLTMRLLVVGLGFPVMISNGFAIMVCCGANFMASDCWVFSLGTEGVLGRAGSARVKPT